MTTKWSAKKAVKNFFKKRAAAKAATTKITQDDIDRVEKRDSAYSKRMEKARATKVQ